MDKIQAITSKNDKQDLNSFLDKVLSTAKKQFVNKEKYLSKQLTRGSDLLRPIKDSDFVLWDNSLWQLLTGIRGSPFGKIVQIAGRPDSGKSTKAMEFMTRAQQQNVIVILWDSEGKFDTYRYDTHFHGDSHSLLAVRCKRILEGSDMVDELVHAIMKENPTQKIYIVWDSVGGTLPTSEFTKAKRDSRQQAEAPKENGMACRGFVQLMERYRHPDTGEYLIGVLLVNQVYSNIGAPGQKESGGQKVEYHSSLIIQLTRIKDLFIQRDGIKRKIGITTRARVKKNHLFSSEDTIAEMKLNVTTKGLSINKNDPAFKLLKNISEEEQNDFIEDEDDDNSF